MLSTFDNKLSLLSLQKRTNGIQLITIEYHSVSFSTIGPFNDISVGLSGTVNGKLKYHSVPLNGTKNPKYHTIQIPLAIIPPGPFKYYSVVFEWYFWKGAHCDVDEKRSYCSRISRRSRSSRP